MASYDTGKIPDDVINSFWLFVETRNHYICNNNVNMTYGDDWVHINLDVSIPRSTSQEANRAIEIVKQELFKFKLPFTLVELSEIQRPWNGTHNIYVLYGNPQSYKRAMGII